MAVLSDYNALTVTPVTNGVQIGVPQTPAKAFLIGVPVNVAAGPPAYIEVHASAGVRGDVGTGNILFRVYRNEQEIYYSLVGIEANFEEYYLFNQLITDIGVPPGTYTYTLTIEKQTPGLAATVIGPLNMSVSVIHR